MDLITLLSNKKRLAAFFPLTVAFFAAGVLGFARFPVVTGLALGLMMLLMFFEGALPTSAIHARLVHLALSLGLFGAMLWSVLRG
ncbi:hypothetical protein sS8_4227 [Methylocaldum marinum]|jgi:apolipoprotein N-acyltransferase|uniref:Uncharacterized protein n=2 Tax=Methylocaldum marinum TaxID=1432792 RepID=A0A250KX14_9GAMM|nr:hypothetical protein sS8_4227 [Methylocaldum marinum]